MANMTDRNTGGNNAVNKLMQAMYSTSTVSTVTVGTGGGSNFSLPTPPLFLRLMTAAGSNTANGTEAVGNGYTALGNSMGSTAFGTPSGGVVTNSNSVSWTASGGNLGGAAIVGVEIWDSAATKLRWLQGSITSVTVASGNTLQFAAASITADASQW